MSSDTHYSIHHFRVDYESFKRLLVFHPKGEYRELDESTICFTYSPSASYKENWFLSDEDSLIWYAEKSEEEE